MKTAPGAATLADLLRVVVEAHPDRIAVSAPDGTLTYRDLSASAQRVADALRHAGVRPGVVVPLLADTSVYLVIGMLGILRAGGAYLPIDPTAPEDRIRWLVEDSGSPVVLATTATVRMADAAGSAVVLADRLPEPVLDPSPAPDSLDTDLAYVIYTSGSTGQPKGVQVEQRNIVRLFERTREWFGFAETDVWTMFHSAAFDFSVWEIWGALLHGGRLVLVPYEVSRSPARFRALVANEGVTVLNQTPSAFRQFIAADRTTSPDDLPALRAVILGGERLDVAMLEPWFERHPAGRPDVVNMFGITECTVHASYRPIRPADLTTPEVSPIGMPLPDLDFQVVDDAGVPMTDGQPGELYISGAGLARGYHRRDDLTAQRFVDIAGRRAYRSGDRVRRVNDTEFEYLGRIDDQLTVRGYRVEPGEVEAVLIKHPEVDACLVGTVDHGAADIRLVAYIVASQEYSDDNGSWERLRAEISARADAALPKHLRPSSYLRVSALPLTRNGKADRSAAMAADSLGSTAATDVVITSIWRDILGENGFGPDDDFFDLGGTSLTLVRMIDHVNTRFRIDLDLTALLDGVTIAALAAAVDSAAEPVIPAPKG
ncbi:amino acid adenylation domain-containing protein [Nocardia sp. NBC_01499]|uniref:amino acid adenylation domain-containing protein n=1 Tax=Nocardia sp. NBC_01499 TaxID=2903597 RepID=UPI0038701D25